MKGRNEGLRPVPVFNNITDIRYMSVLYHVSTSASRDWFQKHKVPVTCVYFTFVGRSNSSRGTSDD